MKLAAALLVLSITNAATAADNPWHYKGISLGEKMSRDQIMAQLGASKYANNPNTSPWKGCDEHAKGDCAFTHYGLQGTEWVEFNIGPLCEDSDVDEPGGFVCMNPWMTSAASSGHGIYKVEVFGRRDGTVTTIDISFDSTSADDFFDVAHRQFSGTGIWTNAPPDCGGPMTITAGASGDRQSKIAPITVDRVCETLTTKRFSVYMTNYDEIFAHVAGPVYQGILEMKLLDQEL